MSRAIPLFGAHVCDEWCCWPCRYRFPKSRKERREAKRYEAKQAKRKARKTRRKP